MSSGEIKKMRCLLIFDSIPELSDFKGFDIHEIINWSKGERFDLKKINSCDVIALQLNWVNFNLFCDLYNYLTEGASSMRRIVLINSDPLTYQTLILREDMDHLVDAIYPDLESLDVNLEDLVGGDDFEAFEVKKSQKSPSLNEPAVCKINLKTKIIGLTQGKLSFESNNRFSNNEVFGIDLSFLDPNDSSLKCVKHRVLKSNNLSSSVGFKYTHASVLSDERVDFDKYKNLIKKHSQGTEVRILSALIYGQNLKTIPIGAEGGTLYYENNPLLLAKQNYLHHPKLMHLEITNTNKATITGIERLLFSISTCPNEPRPTIFVRAKKGINLDNIFYNYESLIPTDKPWHQVVIPQLQQGNSVLSSGKMIDYLNIECNSELTLFNKFVTFDPFGRLTIEGVSTFLGRESAIINVLDEKILVKKVPYSNGKMYRPLALKESHYVK